MSFKLNYSFLTFCRGTFYGGSTFVANTNYRPGSTFVATNTSHAPGSTMVGSNQYHQQPQQAYNPPPGSTMVGSNTGMPPREPAQTSSDSGTGNPTEEFDLLERLGKG